MTNNQLIDLGSARARQARLSVVLDKKWLRWLLVGLAITSGFGWVGLLFSDIILAHLLLIIVAGVAVLLAWYHGQLKLLEPNQKGSEQSIDDLLERSSLGRLKDPVSPRSILEVAMHQAGGIFFAQRFGIDGQFLTKLASDQPADLAALWQQAVTLQAALSDGAEVSDAAIVAAAILATPEHEFYLAQLKIDTDDIIAGLSWHSHVKGVFHRLRQKTAGGGIGRDLSFGWTPLLERHARNISRSVEGGGLLRREIEGHQEVLDQLVHVLSQGGRRNACLVGEVGVGKTTLVYALAQRLIEAPKQVPRELRFRQVVELDASHLLSIAKGRGEIEDLLIQLCNEAIHAKNMILFLDEAQLFLQDGTGSVDLSNILLSILESGRLPIILSLSDQAWLKLSQTNPGLAQLINRIVVSPLDEAETIKVMEDQILLLEAGGQIIYMHQALQESYKLAERFIRDQAFPGKAIRLLEAAAGFAEQQHFITEKSVQQAVEKSFDVKVQTASDSQERDTLLNLEGKIHERMINQTRAVQVVSDALRRARAGVRNQSKPIGTFLFLGPTGVGKTELSKALAAIYFGGEDRLIRVDLNEYSQPTDVSRLLEIGSSNTNSLTAQIAKQPFSVVLLDEIEKAHPNVLNVLLQLLDEGMLRDSQNKPVSFRDAIVIATSNAGADVIRRHIEAGEALEQFEDQFINELIDANIFRPEFLNRFDETVLFRPLTKEELVQVVDLIVGSINKTMAAQKVSVRLTQAAKQLLAETGYDPRLGARPLRRVTQRSIENIMAQKLLSGEVAAGSAVELDAPELQMALSQRS